MHLSGGEASHPTASALDGPIESLRRWPASRLLYVFFSLIVAAYVLGLDRTFVVDQQNYIENFADSASMAWLRDLTEGDSLRALITALFSEELLWRVWTTVTATLLSPVPAILLTVCTSNLLVIVAAGRLERAALAMGLWLVLPVGFAVIGLEQIRQGFAFSIVLFFTLRLRKPVVGTLVAATIHTTFLVALIFVVIWRLLRKRHLVAFAAAVLVAFSGAYLGSVLFDLFGGRRLAEYSVSEGATSVNYVFGCLICLLPSVYWLLTADLSQEDADERVLSACALMHIGTTVFTIFSFFIFPLGAGRVGYLNFLMLIPMLPALLTRRAGMVPSGVFACVLLSLLYFVGKAYTEGTYDVYFQM